MNCSFQKKQTGFSMIEVMIAALVLGVGLLGLMGLQTQALKYNQSAYLYSQATLLVQDIADRMRANKTASGSYEINYGETVSGVSSTKCISASCSSSEIADWDLKLWKDRLETSLPEGDGEVVAVGDQYRITVRFDVRNEDELKTVSITVEI